MYTELITYTKDSLVFLAEVEQAFPDKIIRDEETQAAIGVQITKTPTVRNVNTATNETVAVVRATDAEMVDIRTLKTLNILLEVPYGDDLEAAMSTMTVAKRKLYDKVHNQTPYDVTLPDGTIQTVTPNAFIGGFL